MLFYEGRIPMKDDVKACVNSRLDFINNYLDVTPEHKAECDQFINDITALGESCADYAEFESRFASEGLGNQFNSMVGRIPQKTHKMTKEEKDFSKATMKQILNENKGQIASDIAQEAAETATLHAKDELIAENRKRMIKEGVFDEYARASNVASDIENIFGFFKKRKKDKDDG